MTAAAKAQVEATVRHAEFACTARFAEPSFALLARWVELQAAAFTSLSSHGLRLQDIKNEPGAGNPSDVALACWLFDYGAVVRYRVDRVEAWSNSLVLGRDPERARRIVTGMLAPLRSAPLEAAVDAFDFTITLHAEASAGTCEELLSRYVKVIPDGSSPFTVGGVSFLATFPESNGRGSIVLERSARIPDGIFLRVMTEQPGVGPAQEAVERSIEFIRDVKANLALHLDWEG